MSRGKATAQMQIDVKFISNAKEMFRGVEKQVKELNLGNLNPLKDVESQLLKSFDSIFKDFSKLNKVLTTPNLSEKEYTAYFDKITTSVKTTTKNLTSLKTAVQNIFEGSKNQDLLKQLKEVQKELNKLKSNATKFKANQTNQTTLAKDFKEAYGIDFSSDTRQKIKNKNKSFLRDILGINPESKAEMKEVLNFMERYNKLIESEKKYRDVAKQSSYSSSNPLAAYDAVRKDYDKLESNTLNLTEVQALDKALVDIDRELGTLTQRAIDFEAAGRSAMQAAKTEAEKASEGMQTLLDILKQFGIGFTIGDIVRGFRKLITSSFDFYKSLDSALNEIYVVSSLTSKSVNGLTNDFINMAKSTGMAIDDITRAAVLFYQQGLRTDEVLTMTKVTAQFAKVAGIDATDAADKLTAAVNGYKLSADDASSVADKFNKVAAASAADINELSTAFSKAAAQANQAGVSMDNYLAYIATMEEATREAPENLGTSLKTIFSRMQQIKTGENTEDDVTVNDAEEALRTVGIALRDVNGQLRDLEEIFAELGPKWNSLDRNTQAYLGTIIAGTRQQSRFITLMQNWDRVLDLSEQSANSAGQQALMHEKAMDSIQSKLNQTKVAWQEFVSSFGDSSIIKGVVDIFNKLLNVVNKGTKPITLIGLAVSAFHNRLKAVSETMSALISRGGSGLAGVLRNIPGVGNFIAGRTRARLQNKLDNVTGERIRTGQELAKVSSELIGREGQVDAETVKLAAEKEVLEQRMVSLLRDELDLKRQIEDVDKSGKKGLANSVMGMFSKENIGSTLTNLGNVTMALSTIIPMSENASGLVGGIGTGLSAAGDFISGNWAGGIIKATTAGIQLVKTISNWEETRENEIQEKVEKVGESLQKFSNRTTEVRTVQDLMSRYEALTSKVIRSSEEQKQLNDVIQQLGDMTEVTVLKDQYDNLSISIAEVITQTKKLQEEQAKAEKDLEKIEKENTKGSGETNYEFNSRLITTYYSEYRGLVSGIEDGMKAANRNISEDLYNQINNRLKDVQLEDAKINAGTSVSKYLKENDNLLVGLSSGQLNELYGKLSALDSEFFNLSIKQVEEVLDDFYNRWSGKNKVIKEDFDKVKKAAISVFQGSTSLDNFLTTWDSTDEVSKSLDEAIEIAERMKKLYEEIWVNYEPYYSGTIEENFERQLNTLKKYSTEPFGGSNEAEKQFNKLAKEYTSVYKLVDEYITDIAEQYQISEDSAYNLLENMFLLKDTIKDMNITTAGFVTNIKTLTDISDLNEQEREKYINAIRKILIDLNGETDQNVFSLGLIGKISEALENESPQLQEKLQNIINEVWSNITVPSRISWTNLYDDLDNASSKLRTFSGIMSEFRENGSIAFDTFKDFAAYLDKINLDSLVNLGSSNGVSYLHQYADAIENLQLGFDEASGQFTMAADSMETLMKLAELETKAELQNTKVKLQARNLELQDQEAYVKAQINATDAVIKQLENLGDGEIAVSDIISNANNSVANDFVQMSNDSRDALENNATNTSNWAKIVVTAAESAADAFAKYREVLSGGIYSEESWATLRAKAEAEARNIKWLGSSVAETYGSVINKDNVDALLKRLKEAQSGNYEALERVRAELKSNENMIGLIDKLTAEGTDLSKLGLSDKDLDKLQQYEGKLERIYNILRRIETLDHRHSMLEELQEIGKAENAGSYLREQISLTEELVEQYKFLTEERKKDANGWKEYIENSNVAHVFDFDEFGQIIINWEEYLKLNSLAISGTKSLKEQADELYEKYNGAISEARDYMLTLLKTQKQLLEENQKIIDSYTTMEEKLANAIKEIYQKRLDAQLEAIDKELEALEELKKERERANKERENSKVLSGYQTDLQRAMMDTSGASDSAYIKAQQNISDKLDAMAEDKYSEMIESIKEQLEKEKEVLQDNFDELFSRLDWLYEGIENALMNNPERIKEVLTQTDEWAQMSNLKRLAEMEEWERNYHIYVDSITGNKTIYDVWDKMMDAKAYSDTLQEAIKTPLANAVSGIVTQTASSVKNSISSTLNLGSGSSGKTTGSTYTPSGNYNTEGPGATTGDTTGGSGEDIELSKVLRYIKKNSAGWEIRNSNGGKGPKKYYDIYGNERAESYWGNPNVTLLGEAKRIDGDIKVKVAAGKNVLPVGYDWISWWDLQKTGTLGLTDTLQKLAMKYANGGLANFTGLAWLDGSSTKPEAVLNPLQTKHFINFTNTLDKLYNGAALQQSNANVVIDNISFNVESMSSVADGENAFNAFVNKFKEIGSQQGLSITTTKSKI